MNKAQKLSPAMQSVIDKMTEGWELCRQTGWGANIWLQRDGCGCGGPSERVKQQTFSALYDRGLLQDVTKTRYAATSRYRLKKTDGKAP